jgi:PKD repeat protein
MRSARTILTRVALLGAVCAAGIGCPNATTPPDYTPAIVVSPKTLDFGTDATTMTFTASKTWTSQPMSAFTVVASKSWMQVSPATGSSDGPTDPVTITVVVDRSLMTAGPNTGTVTVSAPGVVQQIVTVTAQARLVANFSVQPTLAYVGDPITFLDLSEVAVGEPAISSWLWDFGDGKSTSTEQNPIYGYDTEGQYTIKLTVGNGLISAARERVNLIQINVKATPDAEFTVSDQAPQAYTAVQFTDLSNPGTAPITSWLWDFGDGTAASTSPSPSHIYTGAASYDVSLTVTTVHGSDTELKVGYVTPTTVGPAADFSSDTVTPLLSTPVQFYDESFAGTSPITSWLWDFGDGKGTSTAQSPTHSYVSQGQFTVSLTVTTAIGSDTATKTNYISVQVGGPAADFTISNPSPAINTEVTFTDTSDPGTAPITDWQWDFGDGTTATGQGPHPHTYDGTSSKSVTLTTYDVTLTVQTDHGSDDVTKQVALQVEPPVANFEADKTDIAPEETVQFTDTSVLGSGTSIVSWAWNFGDGTNGTGQNPAHTYGALASGEQQYTVTLTVTDDLGVTDEEEKIDYITVRAVSADFTADTTFGDPTLTVQFTDGSYGGKSILSRQWDFGDGSPVSTEANPSHDYTVAGSYDVSLTITTDWGDYTETKAGFIQIADPTAAAFLGVNLTGAVLVTRAGTLPAAEAMAATVLVEEIEKRTGITIPRTTTWPTSGLVIALMSREGQPAKHAAKVSPSRAPEGFRMFAEQRASGPDALWILGADGRGALYGAGKLLRLMSWSYSGSVILELGPDLDTAPIEPIRGHEMGYRNTANSYDAWDVATYEQYIRECVIFGANAIQNIPFDDSTSPHFTVTQAAMNTAISDICDRYGIEFWVWTPVNMNDPAARAQALADFATMYAACPRLDGVFLPAGDPGHNPASVMMPFAEQVAALLATHHPDAGVWIGNETLTHAELDDFFTYLQTQEPTWLRGVVYGPWTKITIEETRTRTPSQYKLRRYPDITHSIECQYPVPNRDRALAYTLGRENPNPRPFSAAMIHDLYASDSDGFISYSDGINDDVNKHIWTMAGSDSTMSEMDMLTEYARFFFGPTVASDAVTGILGLETNEGVEPLAVSTSVPFTFTLWQGLESSKSGKALVDTNWRWQLCLLRAYYDKYIQERLVNENVLEANANAILANAAALGADTAMAQAATELAKATTQPVQPALRTRIQQLCQALYDSIGLQTSVALYGAANWERGAILDWVDQPLNNRMWMESEFTRIGSLATEGEKLTEIDKLVNWENPGTGGFYDDLGNASKEPHVVNQKTWLEDPGFVESTQDEFIEIVGRETWRLSWLDQAQTLYGQPLQMSYTGLNTAALYRLRVLYTGRFGATMSLTANGTYTVHGSVAQPSTPQVLSYDLPASATSSGALQLDWTLDAGRGCQVAEVWLEVR